MGLLGSLIGIGGGGGGFIGNVLQGSGGSSGAVPITPIRDPMKAPASPQFTSPPLQNPIRQTPNPIPVRSEGQLPQGYRMNYMGRVVPRTGGELPQMQPAPTMMRPSNPVNMQRVTPNSKSPLSADMSENKYLQEASKVMPQELQSKMPVTGYKAYHDPELLAQYGLDTPERQAHFYAQMGHETGGFKWLEELGGKSYFNKYEPGTRIGKNLGNTQPGDGYRYRGRGLIHLTGRDNYKRYGDRIGVDLVGNPDLAKDPKIALQVALEYWKDKGLNKFADANNIEMITKRINGGLNGLEDRMSRLQKYKGLFGVE